MRKKQSEKGGFVMRHFITVAFVVLLVAVTASSCPGNVAQNKAYGPEVTPGGGAGAPKSLDAVPLSKGAPEIGKPMPDVQFTSLDGKVHKLSDYKGKVLFVNFWGTWCSPCVKEIPDLAALYTENKSKGFEIVGLACHPDDLAAVKKFNDAKKLPYTLAMSSKPLMFQFGFSSVPTTLVIDRSGTVRDMMIGEKNKAFFEGVLKKYI